MYDFLGEYVYFSLYKMVREKDLQRLKTALGRCAEEEDGCVDECVHVVNEEGGYDRYLISIEDCRDSEHYRIEFQNISLGERKLAFANNQCAIMRDYLTISGKACFAYRSDIDEFWLFWVDYDQIIDMYKQPLDVWEKEILERELVQEKEVFRTFCAALRLEEREQNFVFRGKILSSGNSMDTYKIKVFPRTYNGAKMMIGIWAVMNERTGDDVDDYIEGSHLDPMTKILNKVAIVNYAQEAVDAGGQVAVVMIDVDNFKNINDTYGHFFGDQVIIAVADVIKKAIGGNGAVGRMGGDEFMAVIRDFGDEAGLRNYLRSIRSNSTILFQEKLGVNRVTCSIGASRSGIDSNQYKELAAIADKALYIAKEKGKNRFIIYMPEKHGQFHMSEDGYDMTEIRDSFYSEKDLNRFNKLMAEFVLKGHSCLRPLLEQALHILTVSRMVLVWEGMEPMLVVSPDGGPSVEEEQMLLHNGPYLATFTEDVLDIHNVNRLEYTMPDVHKAFGRNGVRSVVQHILRDGEGKLKGMVWAEECVTLKHFPKLALQLFENMCKVVNAVLIREGIG